MLARLQPDATGAHRRRAADELPTALDIVVLTVSDTRTEADDEGGRLLRDRIEQAGHRVASHAIVPDEPEAVRGAVRTAVEAQTHVVITTGGTGVARRDTTVDAIRPLLERKMYGFGELFRMLSYEQVGPAAMLSRALAGVSDDTLIFALPGSPAAIELALDRLILPDLPHLVWEVTRH